MENKPFDIEALKKIIAELSEGEFENFLAKRTFKLDGKEISTMNFLFWFIYYIERELSDAQQNIIKESITKDPSGTLKKAIEHIYDELNFLGKIRILDRGSKRKEIKDVCKYLYTINDLRNKIFHSKIADFNDLLYKDKKILLRATKEIMIVDFYRVFKKAGSNE